MADSAPAACFSDDYAQARGAFLGACGDQGGEVLSHRHPLPGPDGAPLFLDEARFGPPEAHRVLFLVSGTHGVEGFCGSGIQTHLLRDGLARRLPPDVAVVFVHAVNPWGFAWLRRVNEDNVDINRNFLEHGGGGYPPNEDYAKLYDLLNPQQLEADGDAAFLAAVARFESEQGHEAMYRSVSGGQYDHPRGLQFGGRHAVWSNRILRDVWQRHAGQAEIAVNVDLHSGLGPCGVGMLFQTAPATSIDAVLSQRWWPDVLRVEPDPGRETAMVSGLMGPAFSAARPGRASVGVVLEFGTRDMIEVMLAVRADNWLHHHGDRSSDFGAAIVERMREAFYITDAAWKEQLCRRAREVVDGGLEGLRVGL